MSKSITSKSDCSRSSSARSRQGANVVTQTPIDARLHVEFEESEEQFDYSTSIDFNALSSTSNVPSSTVSAYLKKIQRGSLVQPFGCMIAIDDQNFTIIAYSENAPEMLELASLAVPSIDQQEALTFGMDIRALFRSSSAAVLQKAANFGEVNLLNPILVHSRSSGKPFYAILHRVDVGLMIDLEPVHPADVPVTAAGALKSYKLAAKAISRLQSIPSGNISLLCDVLVREVSELTGYDRVMVYKFHQDDHGEVVSECCRPGLEPYLGLHYPATDIPQASRFLFMKNKVRMICDCLAPPVEVLQDNRLAQPLSLCGSTLRAPHGCHAQYMENMGSVASLVMSVTINDEDEDDDDDDGNRKGDGLKRRRLWGLVVCHHTSPRFVPFPLRYACEFLMQVFGVQVSKEVELAAQLREKHILQIQTVLCDMLLRDAPEGIVTQSPSIMDLVKCDGAALCYRNKLWLLGVTPTEPQVKDIVTWLLECHNGNTGLSTDSLIEAGYPGASILGDAVCGMAATRITSKDFLFWFRSHTAKEIKWGGAKHDPDDNDDGRKMHPRSSFKAFLEVVKRRSLPWEDVEMDAIHSLQLILRGSFQDEIVDNTKMIVNVPSTAKTIEKLDELRILTTEMVRLIETASVPVFAVDSSGNVNGWNNKVAELTGLAVHQAIGMPLVDLVVDDCVDVLKRMLFSALRGTEGKNVEIKLKTFRHQEDNIPLVLVVNACCNLDVKENVVGACFIGQDVTGEKVITEKYIRMQGDYVGILRNPCPLIPPIFMMDQNGRCLEWSHTMQNLSGLRREEATERMLLGEVFTVGNSGCRVKDQDTLTKLRILLNKVVSGQDAHNLLFGFFDQHNKYIEALLSASRRTDSEGRITGVLCFLHVSSPELQFSIQVQNMSEEAAAQNLKKLSYLRQEIKNPLNGIKFVQNLMKSTVLSKLQKQLLKASALCEEQLSKIISDTDVGSIEECYMEMKAVVFNLGETLKVVINQVMIPSQEQQVQIIYDLPAEVGSMYLLGDNIRLQQVLSEFLTNAIRFTPAFGGFSVQFWVLPRKESIGTKMHVVHLEFRSTRLERLIEDQAKINAICLLLLKCPFVFFGIIHPAPGVPEELIQEMFHQSQRVSRDGLGLYFGQKLVSIMNGTVQYLREADKSSFIILIEYPLADQKNRPKITIS